MATSANALVQAKANGKSMPDAFDDVDVEIRRNGSQIVLPNSPAPMGLDTAIKILQRKQKEEEAVSAVTEDIEAFPFDGAIALMKALRKRYGWANAVPTPTWFGPQPPQFIDVKTSATTRTRVVWGRMEIPGIEGYLSCGTFFDREGRYLFRIQGEVKRKYLDQVRDIATLTREYVAKESIYRGKAISMLVKDDSGKLNVETPPDFLDLTQTQNSVLIFSKDVEQQIATNVFAPVEHTLAVQRAGVPLKRGILLAGEYGTGKTLTAFMLAKKCEENGWTFILIPRVSALKEALALARMYQPSVVFAEDIDRVMGSQDRTVKVDDILNTIDGIESKNSKIMTVLTTNNLPAINKAMLRPGRLDAIIDIKAPDAEAVERLLRHYAGDHLDAREDLSKAAAVLQGYIPASIREAVERARLYALSISNGKSAQLSGEALYQAANGLKQHMDLMKQKEPTKTLEEQLGLNLRSIVEHGVNGSGERITDMHTKISQTHEKVMKNL
jgi:transitional endoplasmic reticulum ATPase